MTLRQRSAIVATVEFIFPMEDVELARMFASGYDPLIYEAVQRLMPHLPDGMQWSVQRAVAERRLLAEKTPQQ